MLAPADLRGSKKTRYRLDLQCLQTGLPRFDADNNM